MFRPVQPVHLHAIFKNLEYVEGSFLVSAYAVASALFTCVLPSEFWMNRFINSCPSWIVFKPVRNKNWFICVVLWPFRSYKCFEYIVAVPQTVFPAINFLRLAHQWRAQKGLNLSTRSHPFALRRSFSEQHESQTAKQRSKVQLVR